MGSWLAASTGRSVEVGLACCVVLCCATLGAERDRPLLDGVPVLHELPATTPEFKRRVQQYPSLTSLASAGVGIYGGLTELLLGDTQPLGSAEHMPWARPLPSGALRLTTVSTVRNNYDLGEIERRLDCRVRHIQVLRQYHYPQQYPEAFSGFLADRALETVEKHADVFLVSQNIRLLPEAVSTALLAKVEAGAGLVLIGGARYGGGHQYGYWPLHDKIACWEAVSKHLVTDVDMGYKKFVTIEQHDVAGPDGLFDGIPWQLMPAHHVFSMKPSERADVLARDGDQPLAIGGMWGKGRVVLLNWVSAYGAFPTAEDNQVPGVRDYHEYYASALIRAIMWAADRRPAVRVSLGATELSAGESATIHVDLAGVLPRRATADLQLRSLHGDGIWSEQRPAEERLAVELPGLAAGENLLDVTIRDRDGNSVGWGTFVVRAAAQGELHVRLDKDRYLPGERAVISAELKGAPLECVAARARVRDALGRLLFEQHVAIVDGRAQWVFPNREPRAVLHVVDIEVLRSGRPYLAARVDLFVPRYKPEDFTCWLWPGSRPAYAMDRIFRRQRETLGFDVIMCAGYGGTHRAANYGLLSTGCLPFYSNIAPCPPLETEKDPGKARQKILAQVDDTLEELRLHGGLALFFQDERHGRGDSKEPTAEALVAFRRYLEARYRDIGELNQAWGRSFGAFADVVPVLTEQFDANKETSLAPWLEWRLWVLHEIVTTDRLAAKAIRAAVGVPCNLGLEGIFGLEGHNIPYGGTDLAAQAVDCFNIAGPYGEDLLNACRSFYPDFLFSWGGYNHPFSRYRRYAWSCAFQGHGGLGYWYGPIYYNAADCWYPQAYWLRDTTRTLREGVGKLLRTLGPSAADRIAFLYSQPSLYAMCILGRTVDPENPHLFLRPADWARQSLQRLFQDAGVQFGFISEQQLQRQQASGLKLLVLSSCVALEPATCQAIETFVRAGGTVLADLCPGVWDQRGTYQAPGQLDALFGVTRDERFRFETMVSDWGVGTFEAEPDFNIKGQWYIGQYYEQTLKVADGHALGKHIFGPVKPPAFVFKRTGKGAAILMNYLETEYRRVPEHWQVTLATELLRLAGVQPPCVMRDRMQNGESIETGRKLFRWSDGGARYLGVLLDEGRLVEFDLESQGHIYELARGRYLGQGPQCAVDMRDEPHCLLAVLPYRVDGLTLRGGKGRLGSGLDLELQLRADGAPVDHVVHLDVFRPDGSRYAPLCHNVVLTEGRWAGRVPLALNDPAGRWRIEAREVVSGATAALRAKVRK